MKEKTLTINNHAGIHCRPLSVIMAAVNECQDSSFNLKTPNGDSELTSILEVLSLCIQYKDKVTLQVTGGDEDAALKKIGDLFEYEFDFPPQ